MREQNKNTIIPEIFYLNNPVTPARIKYMLMEGTATSIDGYISQAGDRYRLMSRQLISCISTKIVQFWYLCI